MKTNNLDLVHLAWALGAKTANAVADETGLDFAAASSCLTWIRKADGDLELARRLRSKYMAERKRAMHFRQKDAADVVLRKPRCTAADLEAVAPAIRAVSTAMGRFCTEVGVLRPALGEQAIALLLKSVLDAHLGRETS